MPVDPPAWVRDAVFYEIFVDRFARSERVASRGPLEDWDAQPTHRGLKGGDLLGIVEHLDHVADLGATALYLTPIFQSASNHRYHTDDYFRVDPLLGGDGALGELLVAAHGRGLRVILDGVFNHTGRGFWPFHHVLENGAASPYRHWFHLDQAALDRGVPLDAYPAAHGREALARDEGWRGELDEAGGPAVPRLGYAAWWDLPALPKLNIELPAVREYLWSVAEHWLRAGIDGWRLDVPGEIQDPPFWAELRRRCRAVNPEAYLVGELWDPAPDWVGDERFDGVMNYPLAEAILGFVGGASLNTGLLASHSEYRKTVPLDGAGFAGRLEGLRAAYGGEGLESQLNLLGSHDTPRLHSILEGDGAAIRLAVLLQATLPGAPCIYYGDELGLPGGLDPDCRRGFPWDRARWDEGLFAFTRAALRLRAAEPLLRRGEVAVLATAGPAIAFERRWLASGGDGDRIIVAINAGDEAVDLILPPSATAGPGTAALGLPDLPPATANLAAGQFRLRVPPRSGSVVRVA